MSIYTKKGDLGETSNYDGQRAAKTDNLFWLLGSLDELSVRIGEAIALEPKANHNELLQSIQDDCFEIGGIVATKEKRDTNWLDSRIKYFEQLIDDWDKELPTLRNFVLPGGNVTSVCLHSCRVASRATERYFFVTFHKKHSDIGRYLNRLSDLFFQLNRHYLKTKNINERIWKSRI